MKDTIYRQAAIDTINQITFDDTAVHNGWIDPYFAIRQIEVLPSAQPEQQWIPCSERLPEEDEDVLVCSEDGDIDVAYWMLEQWTDEPHIEWWSGEYRVFAVAWMPLPEPYGGESDEQTD